jgi:hypothetical protein
MIFNPYDIHYVHETATSASRLPWSLPQLQDNAVLVVLILVFVVVDILACRDKGVMRHQLSWITDTRNARTFESVVVIYPWLKPLLLIQMFLFFGLTIFCLFDDAPAEHLLHPQPSTFINIAIYTVILLAWYLLQGVLLNWFCYLFDLKEKRTIMNRSYQAAFIVLAPFAMLLFAGVLSGWITAQIALVLLVVLFILSQFAFIFSGIKIFYDGIGSLFLIIAYLCTLEIAPLLVIWAKFSLLQV